MKIGDRVYLDFAAASPLLPEAKAAMEPFLMGDFGNPSAIHQEGVVARRAVEGARDGVARTLHTRPELITFTSGGTEGNNLTIFGVIEALHLAGHAYHDMAVITTAIEHPSITKAMERLRNMGVEVRLVEVDEFGFVKLSHLREIISDKVVLMTVAYANSEIGVVQSTRTIRKVLREAEAKFNTTIYFQVDAAQAPLWLTCQFDTVDADFLVLDAGKCCGPKGVGILARSHRAKLVSVSYGGGQESGLRPGTENVAGIVGAGVALVAAQGDWRGRAERARQVRDEAIVYILENIPQAILNGPVGEERLVNNINISIPELDTEYATVVLDSKGFAMSTKSACAGAGGGESVVVKTISSDPTRARSTLRLTFGPATTLEQLKSCTDTLKTHIEKMRIY